MTCWAGPVNHRKPSKLLTRSPKSVPLRHIVVTTVLFGTPCAASMAHFETAIHVGPEK